MRLKSLRINDTKQADKNCSSRRWKKEKKLKKKSTRPWSNTISKCVNDQTYRRSTHLFVVHSCGCCYKIQDHNYAFMVIMWHLRVDDISTTLKTNDTDARRTHTRERKNLLLSLLRLDMDVDKSRHQLSPVRAMTMIHSHTNTNTPNRNAVLTENEWKKQLTNEQKITSFFVWP